METNLGVAQVLFDAKAKDTTKQTLGYIASCCSRNEPVLVD